MSQMNVRRGCHNLFLKLSPHSSELSLRHHMHLNAYFPGSTRDPNHAQPNLTMHWDALPLHLGLVPRHSSDRNPSASGMQTPSGITGSSHDDHATMHHPCHLVG